MDRANTNPDIIFPGDFRVDTLMREMASLAEAKFGRIHGGTVKIPAGEYSSIEAAIDASTFIPYAVGSHDK